MLAPFRIRGWRPYALGGVVIVLATFVRMLLHPWLGDHLSFGFFFLAVAVAAWTGGIWPAIAIASISAVTAEYFFTGPERQLKITSLEEAIALVLFLIVSLVIGILAENSLRALERAKIAEKAKDDFMATLAHELRSPLTVIHYANALNRLSGPDEVAEHSEMIDQQVRRLSLMVEDLMDVSRVARGKIRLDRRRMDASAVVAAAVEKVKPVIENHRHRLTISVARKPMPLHADAMRLEQVLTNLLTNAAKYTPDGGEIRVQAEPVEGMAVFTVRDNGIGISEEMLPRVFDLFVQDDAASERSEGGLGIGLALVKKLVEMHGGSVHAASFGSDQGSEFVVSLPLEQPAVQPAELVEV